MGMAPEAPGMSPARRSSADGNTSRCGARGQKVFGTRGGVGPAVRLDLTRAMGLDGFCFH